ncbi:Astacin-like metalloendopeptidase [Strongyloides ratti]|uniref:Metalloendopeptidase n=1 Tax=Strongyloides ratti TaxID=34506 RepID=A0A090N074_STRRB|nr:Astacin-like metalloendopeptidase [Strongyloides ratti]CEF70190.1 Astacin-like metalloendopeptidase [Strongyloides ratti]
MILINILTLLIYNYLIKATKIIDYENNFLIQRNKRAIHKNSDYTWQQYKIYYKVDPTITDQSNIHFALEEISSLSCFTFERLLRNDSTDNRKQGLYFRVHDNYGTHLGRKLNFGRFQNISLNAAQSPAFTVMRWVLYALGMDFEHNRPDRNDYLIINKDNIQKQFHKYLRRNKKKRMETFGLNYDYNSIMSLGEFDMGIDQSKKTFERIQKVDYRLNKNNEHLSENDVYLLNKNYCLRHCENRLYCFNGGIQSHRNCYACLCPKYFKGKYCQMFIFNTISKCPLLDFEAKAEYDQITIHLINQCTYSLTSKPGTIIEMNYEFYEVKERKEYLSDEHNIGYIEILFEEDKSSKGIVLSNSKAKGRLYSEDNYIMIMANGSLPNKIVVVRYRQIPRNTRTDDLETKT